MATRRDADDTPPPPERTERFGRPSSTEQPTEHKGEPPPRTSELSVIEAREVVHHLNVRTDIHRAADREPDGLSGFGEGAMLDDVAAPPTEVLPQHTTSAVQKDELVRAVDAAIELVRVAGGHAGSLRGAEAERIQALLEEAIANLSETLTRLKS